MIDVVFVEDMGRVRALIEGQPGVFGVGKNIAEALGDLVQKCPEKFVPPSQLKLSDAEFVVTVWEQGGRFFADRHFKHNVYHCPPGPVREVFSISGKVGTNQDADDLENRAFDEARRRGLMVENLYPR